MLVFNLFMKPVQYDEQILHFQNYNLFVTEKDLQSDTHPSEYVLVQPICILEEEKCSLLFIRYGPLCTLRIWGIM